MAPTSAPATSAAPAAASPFSALCRPARPTRVLTTPEAVSPAIERLPSPDGLVRQLPTIAVAAPRPVACARARAAAAAAGSSSWLTTCTATSLPGQSRSAGEHLADARVAGVGDEDGIHAASVEGGDPGHERRNHRCAVGKHVGVVPVCVRQHADRRSIGIEVARVLVRLHHEPASGPEAHG